jgi:hypothetical protein
MLGLLNPPSDPVTPLKCSDSEKILLGRAEFDVVRVLLSKVKHLIASLGFRVWISEILVNT